MKQRWVRTLAGTGICPICYCDKKPFHVPAQCPLLADLNLKIVAGSPAPAPAPGGGGSAPAPTPSALLSVPGTRPASAGSDAVSSPPAATVAPSGLTALVTRDGVKPDYDTDEDFTWDGDEPAISASVATKLTSSVLPYSTTPLCCYAQVGVPVSPSVAYTTTISLLLSITQILDRLSLTPSAPTSVGRFAVADTGATDHMVPDKLAFISYKHVIGLNVRMGNNSYVPVQGRGSAIFALNGKRVLIQNVLHVPGLAVPLYSLQTHLSQRGCGFFGSASSGFLVYFLTFVLSVHTSVDCHLSFEPLSSSAPLDTLHYAQPRCIPNYYPSEMSPSSSTASPSRVLPALNEDDVSPSPSSDSPSVCSESSAPPCELSDPIHESMAPPSPSALVDLNSVSRQLQQLIATVGQIR